VDAAETWARALAEWAIPDHILGAAPETPWGCPPELFAGTARRALASGLTPTHLRAAEALPAGGVLLDVGCGAGATSLPVARAVHPSRVVAVDEDPRMLEAFAQLAAEADEGFEADLVEGRWPEVASRVGRVDVAVCGNVAYNVPGLGSFVTALTSAATVRVVLELGERHPQSWLSPLWEQFWGLGRPTRTTAGDALAVITQALGLVPEVEHWTGERSFAGQWGPAGVAWARRRLCLPEAAEPQVAAALDQLRLQDVPGSAMATFWWPGRAPGQ